jgi:hypothetical protein
MKISPLLCYIAIFIGNETITMADYLRNFDTIAEFNNAMKNDYSEPWVSCITGSSVQYNFPKYVDLGLPSGTLWMSMNVGATGPYDSGLTFKWGEIAPSTQADNYIYGNSAPYSKYNPTDGKTVLDLSDDAAYTTYAEDPEIPSGFYPHIPTPDQIQELRSNCYYSYSLNPDITTYTSRTNGNKVIFPGKDGSRLSNKPYYGIWSNTVNTNYANHGRVQAWFTDIESNAYVIVIEPVMRNVQYSVRGVLNKLQTIE